MKRQRASILSFLLLFLMLMSCQVNDEDDDLNGRITLWHSWSPEQTIVLENALAEFEAVNPDVQITSLRIPREDLLASFKAAGKDGLGPDILLGANHWIRELADEELIRPYTQNHLDPAFFNARNKALTQYQNQLYGVPLELTPYVLYYNKSMVSQPPNTLTGLLQEAATGNQVAFVPNFAESYWGITAFGESLFDSPGHFTLAESGFIDWLTWLESARGKPGVILSIDDDSLLEFFTLGKIAYYVSESDKQDYIKSNVSENENFEIGVLLLPSGPHGSAKPLLTAETILLYAHSSLDQAETANALAAFLVNEQQSIRFMRELELTPANPAIMIDQQLYPLVYGISRQAKSAIVIPNEIPNDKLLTAGNQAYVNVISGALTPDEAVCEFGLEVASFLEYSSENISLPEGCTFSAPLPSPTP